MPKCNACETQLAFETVYYGLCRACYMDRYDKWDEVADNGNEREPEESNTQEE